MMDKKCCFKAVLLIFVMMAGVASKVHAWGDLGHQTVGEIAEQNLSKEGAEFVYRLMGPEPMAVSATFPDEVRQDARYKPFDEYHYLDFPDQYRFETLPPDQIKSINANTIIEQVPQLLMSGRYSIDQKRIWFRYMIHVMGDIHQPLHVGNTYDLGGNLCSVTINDPATQQVQEANLHVVWDETLFTILANKIAQERNLDTKGKRWFTYKDMVKASLQAKPIDMAHATLKMNPADWYNQSQSLRNSDVYPDQGQGFTGLTRDYCKQVDKNGKTINGPFTPKKVPFLDEKYVDRSIALIEKQLLTAGYRLAAYINQIAKDSADHELTEVFNDKPNPDELSTFMKELHIENKTSIK